MENEIKDLPSKTNDLKIALIQQNDETLHAPKIDPTANDSNNVESDSDSVISCFRVVTDGKNGFTWEREERKRKKYWKKNKDLIRRQTVKKYLTSYEVLRCPRGFFHVSYSTDKNKMTRHYEYGRKYEEYDSMGEYGPQLRYDFSESSDEDEEKNVDNFKCKKEDRCSPTSLDRDITENSLPEVTSSCSNTPFGQNQNESSESIMDPYAKTVLVAAKPRDPSRGYKKHRRMKWLKDSKAIRKFADKIYGSDCTHPYCTKNSDKKEDSNKKKWYKFTTQTNGLKSLNKYYDELELRAEFSQSSDDDNINYYAKMSEDSLNRYKIVDEVNN